MKLHKTLKNDSQFQRGFTLIEILIVIGIFAIILSFSLVFDIRSLVKSTATDEVHLFIHLLERARNAAMNNIENQNHGIHVDSDFYTLFTGDTFDEYNAQNEIFERNEGIVVTPHIEIIFEKISGNLTTEENTEITFGEESDSKTVTINPDGGINW